MFPPFSLATNHSENIAVSIAHTQYVISSCPLLKYRLSFEPPKTIHCRSIHFIHAILILANTNYNMMVTLSRNFFLSFSLSVFYLWHFFHYSLHNLSRKVEITQLIVMPCVFYHCFCTLFIYLSVFLFTEWLNKFYRSFG